MVILMVISLGLAYPPTKAYAAGKNVYKEDEGLELTRLINIERAKIGVDPLTYSPVISAYPAKTRAEEITELWGHDRPNGKSFGSLMSIDNSDKDDDIEYGCIGENIAAIVTNAKAAFEQWFGSAGHRANMLSADFTHMGIGHYYYSNDPLDYKHYWSQIFIGPKGGDYTWYKVTAIALDPKSKPDKIELGTPLSNTGLTVVVATDCNAHQLSILPLFDPKAEFGKSLPTYSVSGYDPNKEGEQTITIKYKGASTNFKVTVGNPAPVTLSRIEAKYTGGAKLVGQSVNAAEVSVTAVYSDGSTKPVTSGFSVAANKLVEGLNTITVSYDGKSAEIPVEATKPATLVSIEVQKYNGGNKYANDTISASDFVVVGTYSDGSTKIEGGNITVSPTTLKAGKNIITLTCGGKTTYYELNCEARVTLKSITVSYKDKDVQKFENDTISITDFKVIATYSDKSTKDVTSSASLSQTKLSAGTNSISVSFGGKAETISVSATKLVAQELIISKNFSSKTEGDTYSASDFTVKVKYNSGKTAQVNGWSIKEFGTPLKAGKNKLTFEPPISKPAWRSCHKLILAKLKNISKPSTMF